MHVLGACDVTYVFRNYLDHFCSFCEMGASEAIATIHNAHYHNLQIKRDTSHIDNFRACLEAKSLQDKHCGNTETLLN